MEVALSIITIKIIGRSAQVRMTLPFWDPAVSVMTSYVCPATD